MTKRTLIIAEAGVNHGGDLDVAKRLVDVAAEAGADLVKFQTFSAKQLAIQSAPKAEYQIRNTSQSESQQSMLSQLELTEEMHQTLIAHCKIRGVGFLSSGFDLESIDYLAKIGLELFKIPSGEITNLPYLYRIGTFGKPLILSTGMSTLGEIEAALATLESAGSLRSNITILHCNTEYPTPMIDVNLRAMINMGHIFNLSVGYSDHTLGIEVPIAAVALGATIIEKHITLNRELGGPDHKASLEPGEFAAMVHAIRNIEQALGDGVKRVTSSELKNLSVGRKSLVASRFIRAGELFSDKNIVAKRPGHGISPMRWHEVIGRQSCRDFQVDELIEL